MAETIPINHCAAVKVVPLPSKAVVTKDGHQLTLGSIVYFRYGVGPAASEYAVVSGHAIKETADYKVGVVGPAGYAGWMSCYDFVKDIKEWWAFYQKRYAPTPPPKEEETDGRQQPTRRKRGPSSS
jgi:hypothetical protein